MYRRRGYRRSQRRKEELRGYLQKILLGLSVLCIIIVCAAVAVKTRKATQNVEAATALMQASTVTVKTETVRDTGAGAWVKSPEDGETKDGSGAAIGGEDVEAKDGSGAAIGGEHGEAEEGSSVSGGGRIGETRYGAQAEQNEEPSTIIIDPGHGGADGGCVFDDVVEKDINRMIAARVVVKLRNMGYQAELAREGDAYIDKLERVENANAQNALLYISIHQNSCEDESVAGIETWYDGTDTGRDSGRLARLIQQETVRETGAVSRELVSESELCVTSKSTMPSCLIETGFLSNEEERGKLITGEYRDRLAEGIARGIDMYLNPRTLYLTFDDGPSEENTDRILDILKERNVKATFFVIGEYVRKYPETARRIVREGHAIGIHCDVHDYKTLYASVDSYMADFQKAYDTVYEVTGVEARLFRFPGGSVNAFNKKVSQEIITAMEAKGFIYYDWNASLEDATGKESSPEKLVRNALGTAMGRQKVVLLAHDRVTCTADALPALLDAFPEYRMEPLTVQSEPVHF